MQNTIFAEIQNVIDQRPEIIIVDFETGVINALTSVLKMHF